MTRPPGAPMTYACRACAIQLSDGVDYTECPRCGGEVEWVDIDPITNDTVVPKPASAARTVLVSLVAAQAVLAVIDPHGFPYLRWLTFLVQLAALHAVALLPSFVSAIAVLARDRRTRILHGLEHATINVLGERGIGVTNGRTHERSFTIELAREHRRFERTYAIGAAANDAIRRVATGETALAYSPLCGTSWLVGHLLVSCGIVAAGIVAYAYGVPHGYNFAGTVAAIALTRRAAVPLGLLAQRLFTVSTALASARIDKIERWDQNGKVGFQVFIDVVPRDRGGGEAIAIV